MPLTADLPTVGELYATAIGDGIPDRNIIGAAGMARDHKDRPLPPLATSLYRLRCEFDSVKAVMRLGRSLTLTDRLLVLMELKSLPGVKLNMGSVAIGFAVDSGYIKVADDGSGTILSHDAEGKKIGKDLGDVFKTTGHAIDLWLSPLCPGCDGVGRIGKPGAPQQVCGTCGGSGHRDSSAGSRKSAVFRDPADRRLGRALLVEMDRLVASVEEGMKRKMQRGAT